MRTRFTAIVLTAVVLLTFLIPFPAAAQTTSASSLIVKVVAGLTTDQQAAIVGRNGGTITSSIPALRLLVVSVSNAEIAATLARYQADPQVQNVEENKVRVSEALPSDALYVNQWALPRIGWDQVFGVVNPTGSARVALLDTGVDASHPELAGKVVAGTSILDGSDGLTDPSGHGTWLAGIIAARTNNGLEGIAGVAFAGVQVMPVTVLNANGEGQDSDVIAGVIWAADHGADVILMAFSNPGFSPNLQDAIDYAWSKGGAVIVASAGNNASSVPHFPAGDRGVMGVAATDQGDGLAGFSNSGQAVFIAAPGVDIQTIDLHGNYVAITGTSTAAAHVAGFAAFMKAVDGSLSNGVIAGRIARNADPAGTQEQTGNGRINMPRALADMSTESIQPAGAAPVGSGGPFVGPYVASNVRLVLSGGLNIVSPAGAIDKTINRSQQFTVRVTISNQNNAGDQSKTWSGVGAVLSVPFGWAKGPDLAGATLGPNVADTTAACAVGVATNNCTFTWIVTAPDVIPSPNTSSITVTISGTPSGGAVCSGGNKCTDTAEINGIAVVNPASISITSALSGAQQGSPGDSVVKSGDTIALAMTVSNGTAPRATANSVSPSPLDVTAIGTASASCGAGAPASANIAAGNSQVFSYTCGTIAGDGTLSFGASASGTDENTGDPISAGPTTSNTMRVDNTAPTSGLSPAAGNVFAPFTFTWNITDPTAGGVNSGIKVSTCNVTVDSVVVSTLCSGSRSLDAGPHSVIVTASDNAGNPVTDSRNYTVIADNTAPVVTVNFPDATGENLWYITAPVGGTVTANDTTTGGSNVIAIECLGATVGPITGLGTPSASAEATVAGEGTHSITCTARDSALNNGAAPTSRNTATIRIDTVPPTITAAINPASPAATGWYNATTGAPSVSFMCSDNTSGISGSCPAAVALGDGDNQTVARTIKDVAGHSTTATLSGVKVDTTLPTVNVTGVSNGTVYLRGNVPTAGCTTSDATSGVAVNATISVTGGTINGVGVFTAKCDGAKDNAGNLNSATVRYTVAYTGVSGILQPINPDNSSVFKRGQAVPVKLQVAGDEFAGFYTGAWTLQKVAVNCDLTADGTPEEVGSVTPSTIFRYDPTADQYVYNADFRTVTPGSCWRVKVALDDASTVLYSAFFKVAK
jgi:subtilisin family serine protease